MRWDSMMKKSNVLTFCTWTSIGSILQSYGLKKALEQVGCESTILLPEGYNAFITTRVRSVKSLISRSYQILIHRARTAAHQKRCCFIDRKLDVLYYKDYAALEEIGSEPDGCCYIAGSDQIWNPDRCYRHFFLDFVRDHRCISYAASMGTTEIPEKNREKLRSYLRKFDCISVREEQCREALQLLTDQDIRVHIDPTFLLRQEQWRSLEQPYPVTGHYILVYMIYWDPACKVQLQELKRRTGLPVYAVCSSLSRVYADHRLFDVGVEEFLWLVDHASYVVTSSFHGAAMSVIFEKKFAAVVNPTAPSRLRNLLDTLAIPLVPIRELDTSHFSYDTIRGRITAERSRGLDYLSEAISK